MLREPLAKMLTATAVILTSWNCAGADDKAAGKKPAEVEVRLPAEALLELNGIKTTSTGNVRRFVSPLLTADAAYFYILKANWHGKEVMRTIQVRPGDVTVVTLQPQDFAAAQPPAAGKEPAPKQPAGQAVAKTPVPKETEPLTAKAPPPAKDGYVVLDREGRWWVFRAGSKELTAFEKEGEPEKHVTRLNAGSLKITLKAPDAETLEEYLATKPGFIIKCEDGRLWIFRKGSKEMDDFQKDGELAKHVVRPGAGPGGKTLKAPDTETIVAYLTSQEGFETVLEDGRLWVFRATSKELAEYRQQGELAKHVTRVNAGPLGLTLKAPDVDTIEAYKKACLK
jgi:uncharacterized protein (TIGR03000 family)